MKKSLLIMPFVAIVMVVGMVCSCGNGSKKQVEASETPEDSLAVASEESPSNPFVGRYYKGEGNGGGMVSEMAISFLDDGKCVCYSDFYKAYPDKEFIHGTYEAKDDKVIVHCLVDDTTYDYEFEIKDGGKTIGYDHSDPASSRDHAFEIGKSISRYRILRTKMYGLSRYIYISLSKKKLKKRYLYNRFKHYKNRSIWYNGK